MKNNHLLELNFTTRDEPARPPDRKPPADRCVELMIPADVWQHANYETRMLFHMAVTYCTTGAQ